MVTECPRPTAGAEGMWGSVSELSAHACWLLFLTLIILRQEVCEDQHYLMRTRKQTKGREQGPSRPFRGIPAPCR